jgi:uncharacterized membrane protein YhaH (DUF805 family)
MVRTLNEKMNLFLSFTGRIPRRLYWFGFAIVVLVFGLGRYVLKYHLGYGGIGGREEWPITFVSTLAAIPLTALSVKRFHDRNRRSWLGYAVGASIALFIAAPYFGYLIDLRQFSPAEHAIFWPLFALSLFALIDNGFLPGTAGSNQFGPDPIVRAPRT